MELGICRSYWVAHLLAYHNRISSKSCIKVNRLISCIEANWAIFINLSNWIKRWRCYSAEKVLMENALKVANDHDFRRGVIIVIHVCFWSLIRIKNLTFLRGKNSLSSVHMWPRKHINIAKYLYYELASGKLTRKYRIPNYYFSPSMIKYEIKSPISLW